MPAKSKTKTAPPIKRPRYAKSKDPIYNLTKPSELIRHALKDLSTVEKQRDTYRIDMDKWHQPNSHCTVCFAGSVMAQTFRTDPKKELCPSELHIDVRSRRRLALLNRVREGEVYSFVQRFYYDEPGYGKWDIADAVVKKAVSAFEPDKPKAVTDNLTYRVPVLRAPKNAKERKVFKQQMSDIATKLESVGL